MHVANGNRTFQVIHTNVVVHITSVHAIIALLSPSQLVRVWSYGSIRPRCKVVHCWPSTHILLYPVKEATLRPKAPYAAISTLQNCLHFLTHSASVKYCRPL